MALKVWVGGAKSIAQVSTYLVGSSTNGHVFTILLRDPRDFNSADVTIATYTAGGAETATTIATELLSLLTTGALAAAGGGGTGSAAGWKHDLNQALTWSRNTATLTATANVSGVPFILTDSGSGTATVATTTSNAGPNDWNTPSNWSTGAIPVAADDVVIDGTYDILYPEHATPAALTTLTYNGSASHGYNGIPARIDTATLKVDNSAVLHLETSGTDANAIHVVNTGQGSDYGCNIYWANSNPATVKIEGGSVLLGAGINARTITSLNVANGGNAEMRLGTATNIYVDPVSSLTLRTTTTATLIQNHGTLHSAGSGAITTFHQNAGTFISSGTGTITTLNANGGLTDFTQSRTGRTVTTLTQQQAASVIYDDAIVTVGVAGNGYDGVGPIERRGLAAPARRTN